VLIETITAVFEAEEILYELREHTSGLNCGRWDYMFSFIKTLKADPACVLPDRGAVTMEQHFLRSYTELLVQTCHRRRAHAMGGMAAQIPIKSDPVANAAALDKVKADKLREVKAGHDGTWVAHPGLVALATQVFDEYMRGPHQLDNARLDVKVTAQDLLAVPSGPRTERGLMHNVDVGVRYLAAWLSGSGCVPIYNLMEDAATAEISRTQIWQWVKHRVRLDDGRTVTPELVEGLAAQVVAKLGAEAGELYDQGTLEEARTLFAKVSTAATFEEFLTVPAYERLIEKHEDGK
jgi:malate synthase